jgi:hypothetical protein
MKRQPALVLTLLVVIVFSVSSRADDDGNFCTSKGYLAYELREGVTPGVIGHVLKVVRFDAQSGIHSAGEVALPDFQVHAMSCSTDRIEISGPENVIAICLTDAPSPQKTSIVKCTGDFEQRFGHYRKGPEPPNLGQSARPGSISLESTDTDHKYELRLSLSSRKVEGKAGGSEGGWEVHHKTELIRMDARGNVSERFLVCETRI